MIFSTKTFHTRSMNKTIHRTEPENGEPIAELFLQSFIHLAWQRVDHIL